MQTTPMRGISGIVLASGSSKRMGCNKLALLHEGKPLLQHVIDVALASSLRELIVVLPSYEEAQDAQAWKAQQAFEEHINFDGCTVRRNPLHSLGQAESLKVGVEHLIMHASPDLTGAMVFLGDQPFIQQSTVHALLQAAQEAPTSWIVPQRVEDGLRGNPVIIPAVEFVRVLQLCGDTGARPLLANSLFPVVTVPISSDQGPFVDIDTPQAYEKYCKE